MRLLSLFFRTLLFLKGDLIAFWYYSGLFGYGIWQMVKRRTPVARMIALDGYSTSILISLFLASSDLERTIFKIPLFQEALIRSRLTSAGS